VAGSTIDLDGSIVADSRSVGSVEEVLRILSGQVYYLPANAVVGSAAGVFPAARCPAGNFLRRSPVLKIKMNSVSVDDTVTLINLVFTAKATESIESLHFSQSGTDSDDARSLAAVINSEFVQARLKDEISKYTNVPASILAEASGPYVVVYSTLATSAGAFGLQTSNSTRLPANADTQFVAGAYRPFRTLVANGALYNSALSGSLSKLASPGFSFNNPSFAYHAVTGTAKSVSDSLLSSTVAPAITVFSSDGNIVV
jgi:hypothetical protein